MSNQNLFYLILGITALIIVLFRYRKQAVLAEEKVAELEGRLTDAENEKRYEAMKIS